MTTEETMMNDAEQLSEEGVAHDDNANRPGLEKAQPAPISRTHLKSVLESLVFVADKPVTEKELGKLVRTKPTEVRELLIEVSEEYRSRGIELVEVAGGWQFRTAAANAPFVRDYVAQKPVRLTRAQLETLSILAYRQPVTRPEIDEIRGVDSGSALKILLDRNLVKIIGKKEEPGRPLLYGTTPAFLEFFGLNALKDLPTLREFTDLSDESRSIFERKLGEPLGDLMQAASEGASESLAAAAQEQWDPEAGEEAPSEVGDEDEDGASAESQTSEASDDPPSTEELPSGADVDTANDQDDEDDDDDDDDDDEDDDDEDDEDDDDDDDEDEDEDDDDDEDEDDEDDE